MSKSDFDFTEDELSALSDEEKEALGIEIDVDNGGKGVESLDDDDDNEEIEPVETPVEEPTLEPAPAEAQPVEQNVEPQPTIVDTYISVNAEIEKLGTSMEDGDIGFAEYNKKLNELISQKTRLEIAYENEQQAQAKAANDWNTAQDRFFSDPVHATIKDKPLLYSALNVAVTDIANSKDASGKSYDWILQQAKARVESELGVSLGGTKQAQPQQKKALDTVNLPKTLGNIPASQVNDSDNEFAYLDRMTPTQREVALAKMKPEDMNRYMAQG